MPTFRIHGASRTTAEPITLTVDATDEHHARDLASAHGVLVSWVEQGSGSLTADELEQVLAKLVHRLATDKAWWRKLRRTIVSAMLGWILHVLFWLGLIAIVGTLLSALTR